MFTTLKVHKTQRSYLREKHNDVKESSIYIYLYLYCIIYCKYFVQYANAEYGLLFESAECYIYYYQKYKEQKRKEGNENVR